MQKENTAIQAFLYTDITSDSVQAKGLLVEHNIRFLEAISPKDYLPGNGFYPPVLHTIEGEFVGLEQIRGYIRLVTRDISRDTNNI